MTQIGPFTKEQPAAPPPGDIPGLRGAPVRTPVKTAGAQGGADLLPAVVGRLFSRQLWIELYGMPGYTLTLKGRVASGIASTPRDFRPIEPEAGKEILAGRFILAGAAVDAPAPDDPFDRPSPHRAFAVELHGFAWLPALMQEGEKGAKEALRLTLAWHQVFQRWSPFAWSPDVLARRTFRLACAARKMAQHADEADRRKLCDLLGRQARQLLRPPGGLADQASMATAAAVAGCALAGTPGASLRRRALSRLKNILPKTVGADGAHSSRSPEAGLELLLDLLTLEDGLAQVSEPSPKLLAETLQRLSGALDVLTLPDGRLATFQGGGPSSSDTVAAAADAPVGDEDPRRGEGKAGGFIRMRSPLITLITDAAAPARGAWSETACAQPLAIEIACGPDRLITGCGWTPRVAERQGLRLTPGHSTLTLGEGSTGEPLGGWKGALLGPRLLAKPLTVTCSERHGEAAVWLEAEHDGWVQHHGLLHQRRLYLDQRLDELRAEERLHPAPGRADAAHAIAAPYAVRFHLEPGVQASLSRDRRSILLRGHSGRGWWFRTDGPDVALESSVHIDEGLPRRALQIVVRGSARTNAETRIRWKLSPAGAPGDPH